MPSHTRTTNRLVAVDASRGMAMLFVVASHMHYYVDGSLSKVLLWLGYVATPIFLLLSGFITSYQLQVAPGRPTALKIVDRGLFVLLVGHVFVVASCYYMAGSISELLGKTVITDTIGFLLCCTWWLRFATRRQLAVGGAALVVASWAAALFWPLHNDVQGLAGSLLLGIRYKTDHVVGVATPLLPYLGIFMVGMSLGALRASYMSAGRGDEFPRLLAKYGAASMAMAVGIFLAAHPLRFAMLAHAVRPELVDMVVQTFDPRHKVPPSPAYVLFYGGFGVLIVGLLMIERVRAFVSWPAGMLATIGRASLMAFIAQQWIVEFVPRWLGFGYHFTSATALAYLALTCVVLLLLSLLWDGAKANRFLTVGLRPARDVGSGDASLLSRVSE